MLKRVSEFIVGKRSFILAVMLAVAIICIFMMNRVEINEDMTKYLPDGSSMKTGIHIMADEFSETKTLQTIRVMFDGLSAEQKSELQSKLEAIPYVDSVSYDADSKDYNSGGYTLLVINTEYDYNSPEELSIEKAIDEEFKEYSVIWHNDDTDDMQGIPTWIIAAALAILMLVLLAMCGSWFEPVLFIAVIGIAVIINMGTNIIMGSVSDVTFSIAAILQLVLSMDYSIILINRYRQECKNTKDKKAAMRDALTHAFPSIAASSLTTVTGLLMLIFMSFKIGMDLGIVLAKGVFISMFCVLTMLPGLILMCDRLIQKTAKKELHIPMKWASLFSCRFRYVLGIAFILLLAGVCFLQTRTKIAYTLQKEDNVAEIFPATNTLVVIYANKDEKAAGEIAEQLEGDKNVKSVTSCFTVLGRPYTYAELSEKIADIGDSIALDEDIVKMLYYSYFAGDTEAAEMTVSELFGFISEKTADGGIFTDYIGDEFTGSMALIGKFADADMLTAPMNAEELGEFFNMNESEVKDLLLYYYIQNGGAGFADGSGDTSEWKISAQEFIGFVSGTVMNNPDFSGMIDNETSYMLMAAKVIADAAVSGEKYTAAEMSGILAGISGGMNGDIMETLYLYAAADKADISSETMSIETLFGYLTEDVLNDAQFAELIDDETRAYLYNAEEELETGKKQLVGNNYSRMIISTGYLEESPETTSFIGNLNNECAEKLSGDFYIVGSSAMNYEMQQIFDKELIFITLLTAIAIFIIVALTFKSLSIPLILVLTVQCGVYATVSVIGLQGGSIYYLALLIVECILMGATIDYGILFTNYYVESRRTLPVKEALSAAYSGSTHTILTSGLILILVTAIVGNFFEEPTVSAIVKTISIGALSATLLILFVLPGVLAVCDKLIIKKSKKRCP